MNLREQVGDAAGQVWRVLDQHGPQTVAQLKRRLNGSAELVSFAVGWLAREDKLDISLEKKAFRLKLR